MQISKYAVFLLIRSSFKKEEEEEEIYITRNATIVFGIFIYNTLLKKENPASCLFFM